MPHPETGLATWDFAITQEKRRANRTKVLKRPYRQPKDRASHDRAWIKELRTHWGRLFEILELHQSGFGSPANRAIGHGWMLLRPRQISLTRDDLERDEPGEDRYVTARRHHMRQLAKDGLRVAGLLGQQPTPYTSPYAG